MASISRPYGTKLRPDARKKEMLDKFFNTLTKGQRVFADLALCIYGSLTLEMAKSLEPESDSELVCAIGWFRLVDKTIWSKDGIKQENLVKQYEAYSGKEASEVVKTYLNSPSSDKYVWIDCRQKFLRFQRELGTRNLSEDFECMLFEQYIRLTKGEIEGYAAISNMFGNGEKEDRSKKRMYATRMKDWLEANENITWEQYREALKDQLNAKTLEQVVANYKGNAGGADPFFKYSFSKEGMVSKKEHAQQLDKFKTVLKNKARDLNFPNKEKLKQYLEAEIGIPVDANVYSQMFSNGVSEVQPKTTRNMSFSNEKLDLLTELKDLNKGDGFEYAREVLNGFFDSELHTTEDKFNITSRYLGGDKSNRLSKLYKIWKKEGVDCEEGIQQFCEAVKDKMGQIPIRNVLKYLWQFRETVSAEDFEAAAKANHLEEKISRVKAHPIVISNRYWAFGTSALVGNIMPADKRHQGEYAGQNFKMWLEAELHYDGKKAKHHLPFYNARFFEEVYCYHPSVAEITPFKTKQFGCEIGKDIPDYVSVALKDNPYKKATKRILRAIYNPVANTTGVDKTTNCSFMIKRENDEYKLVINRKISVDRPKRIEVGRTIMGYDRNQTASDTYWIGRLVPPGTRGAYRIGEWSVQYIKSGPVLSSTQGVNNSTTDQLVYNGMPSSSERFKAWKKARMAFIRKLIRQLNDEGLESKGQDYIPENPSSFDVRGETLYVFNSNYLKALVSKHRKAKKPVEGILDEIEAWTSKDKDSCSLMRLSSLSDASMQGIASLKSLINSYFNKNGCKTIEDKEKFNPVLYAKLVEVEQRRTNKRSEKVGRIAGSLEQLALLNGVEVVIGEADLGEVEKGKSKKQNSRNMDWCAKQVAQRLEYKLAFHGIGYFGVNPMYTSHQDPFEHRRVADHIVMRARFEEVNVENIAEWHVRNFSNYLRADSGTGLYYKQATMDFLKHYGLEEHAEGLENKKIKFYDFRKILEDKNLTSVIIPKRGGRIYMATNPVTSDSTPITYAGKTYNRCNADEVAAANIVISVLAPRSKKNEEQDDIPLITKKAESKSPPKDRKRSKTSQLPQK